MRSLAIIAALALSACNTTPTQVTGTLKPAPDDPNAITLSASVVVSHFWMKAYDVTILMNGEKVMTADWRSSDISGKFRGRRAWAKCTDRLSLKSGLLYDVVCNVYVDAEFIGEVTATPED